MASAWTNLPYRVPINKFAIFNNRNSGRLNSSTEFRGIQKRAVWTRSRREVLVKIQHWLFLTNKRIFHAPDFSSRFLDTKIPTDKEQNGTDSVSFPSEALRSFLSGFFVFTFSGFSPALRTLYGNLLCDRISEKYIFQFQQRKIWKLNLEKLYLESQRHQAEAYSDWWLLQ